MSCLRGQAYDGAGNMAGSVDGVVKSLEVTSVRNMMGVVEKVYQFLDERQRAFEKSIVECQPSTTSQTLKDLGRTPED